MSTQGCFSSDPDITGLGVSAFPPPRLIALVDSLRRSCSVWLLLQVRINLYASSLIIAILPETPLTYPLIDVCRANATMSGFALLVTAIVRTAQHQLTLYHAIFILHMLFFLGIGVFPTGELTLPTSIFVRGRTYSRYRAV